jgi:hypothetical protein
MVSEAHSRAGRPPFRAWPWTGECGGHRIDACALGGDAVAMRAETGARTDLDRLIHYLVDSPAGPVGIVDDWVVAADGAPVALVAAQGWFGRRRYAIPARDVVDIDHGGRRVLVSECAAPVERPGRIRRALARGRARRPATGRHPA